jgi:multimeric flavodoxin WrbA
VAYLVADGVSSVSGVTVKLFKAEEAVTQMDALDTFDAIVFGAPTYMGSASAGFKTFADATAKKWFTQAWKDKVAAGFTNSGGLSGDKLSTLQSFSILAAQHGMIWVGLADSTPSPTSGHGATPDMINRIGSYLGLMTQSDNTSPENTPSPGDQETARRFGVRLAEITKRWVR